MGDHAKIFMYGGSCGQQGVSIAVNGPRDMSNNTKSY